MRSFKKTSNFGGRDSGRDSGRPSERSFKKFSGKSSGKYGGSSERPRSFGSKESKSGNGFKLHEAICDKCGNKCDLPFEPTSGKPIYCRSCFREVQSSGATGGSFKKFEPRSGTSDRFESRNDKKFDRSDEFKEPATSAPSTDALDKINRKLDKIMKALKIE
jgi:CxxC-x17-CxxC domain-containing protein